MDYSQRPVSFTLLLRARQEWEPGGAGPDCLLSGTWRSEFHTSLSMLEMKLYVALDALLK